MAPPSLTRKLTETFCRGLGGGMPAAAGGGGGGGISAAAAAAALFASARAFSSRSLSRFALISAVCCCTFFTSVPGFALRDDFISRRSSSAELMVDSLSVPTRGPDVNFFCSNRERSGPPWARGSAPRQP